MKPKNWEFVYYIITSLRNNLLKYKFYVDKPKHKLFAV